MNRYLFALIATIFALGATNRATATDIQIGNVAPASGEVQMYVDGVPLGPSLAYLAFSKVERADGPLRVEARTTGDHRVLAAATLELRADARIQPMLVLAGNGSAHPYSLRLYQRLGDAEGIDRGGTASHRGKAEGNSAVARHLLAPYLGAAGDSSMRGLLDCRHPGYGGRSWSGIGGPGYGYMSAATSPPGTACRLLLAHPSMGSFDVSVTLASERTARLILVGDGSSAPFRIVVAQDGVVLQVAEPSAPQPGALIGSEDVWFDVSRPAQFITLYEIPGGPDVFGFWFTHNADGSPTWFFFEGAATGLPGQRDLTMHRGTGNDETPTAPVGSARLFYLDCNNAELRVLSGEREFHTLRLRRSREVDACDAME